MRVAVDANTVLSGLFFSGNERRLLLAALRGAVGLVLAEDTLEEVYEVIGETFRDHADLPGALDLLDAIVGSVELVPRRAYAERVARWVPKLRDPSDAGLLACAEAVHADGVVSGDRDVLEMKEPSGPVIYRTREVLNRLP